ncbi:signal peptidase II [Actinomyces ruminicola]|uniref:signal peptidase II n=1 Tax=Actinomyces ruminicola TaxID=332524 RepID=UPI00109DAE54|nr:signal peptidase II [Actinomyces ruminicola]
MNDLIEPVTQTPPDPGEATDESSAAASGQRPRRRLAVLWLLALVVVVVDQATKAWAVATLSDGRRLHLLGDWLSLVLVRNPGAAFSFATGQTWIFALIAIAVTVVVVRVSRRLGSSWWAVALGLVLGGAVGNLIDRLVRAPGVLRGHVVDFIDYGGWFVGNVADIAIVAAAAVIMVLSLRGWEIDGTRVGESRGRHSESEA